MEAMQPPPPATAAAATEGCSPRKRRRADAAQAAQADTRRRNAAHREAVAARLTEQLDPHRLALALRDLDGIAASADDAGIEFAMFEALDELMAGMDHDADLGAVIATESDGQDDDDGQAGGGMTCAVLTLVGRYCQLWERPALALGHFRAAVEDAACSSEPPDALAAAQRGVSQCAALLRWRAEALSSCVRWWTAPHTAPPYFCESGLQAFRRMATQPSDVIMASYPKCGTSWLHQILFRCALVSLRCALKKPCAPYD
jgi:hypothetical protein